MIHMVFDVFSNLFKGCVTVEWTSGEKMSDESKAMVTILKGVKKVITP